MNRIQRRRFAVVTASLLAQVLPARAAQIGKPARIGFLASDVASDARALDAFRRGLRELGYVEGQNLTIEFRFAEGKFSRLPVLAAELIALQVDVIVASSTPAAIAAKQGSGVTPVVFVGVGDPVTSGLVANLAKPGGNVTGLSVLSTELVGKWLELLKQTVPA